MKKIFLIILGIIVILSILFMLRKVCNTYPAMGSRFFYKRCNCVGINYDEYYPPYLDPGEFTEYCIGIVTNEYYVFDTNWPSIMEVVGRNRVINNLQEANDICSYAYDVGVEIYDNHNNATEEYKINIWLFLNSSIAWLWREISGRKNLGGGLLKAEATDLRALPLFFNFKDHKEIIRIYDDLKKRNAKDTLYEIETEEHRRIDDLIFNYLGLSINSRKKIIGLLKYLLENRYRKSKT